MHAQRLRPSTLVALSAAVLALTGTGLATATYRISSSAQIKDASVTGDDVRNASLGRADVRAGSLAPADVAGAPQGPAGDAGPQGPTGEPGAPGADASGLTVVADVDGNVVRGSGVVSVRKEPPNDPANFYDYEVTFDRAVRDCAAIATPGGFVRAEATYYQYGFAVASPSPNDPRILWVVTHDRITGIAWPSGFHLSVFC